MVKGKRMSAFLNQFWIELSILHFLLCINFVREQSMLMNPLTWIFN